MTGEPKSHTTDAYSLLSPTFVASTQQRSHVAQTQRVASTQHHVNNSCLHNYMRIVCV